MKQLLLIGLIILAGMLQPIQAGMNSTLARHLGHPSLGALWNFTLGLVAMALLAAVVFRVPLADLARITTAPKWALWGGLCGATIVISFILGFRPLGGALLVSLFILGQLTASVVLDHFAWLGLQPRPANTWRLAGVACLIIGVILIERGGPPTPPT